MQGVSTRGDLCGNYRTKKLPERLASKMGMRLGPTDVVDVFLGYLSSGYKHYYKLPPDPLIAFDFVIKTFKEAARRYKAKSGNIPTIFIDGTDLLAKIDPEAFIQLICHGKILANELVARIVFISSEGSIMPILKSTSAMNRSTSL